MAIFGKKKIETIYELDPEKIPAHVGIIMDGNGRWAKKRGMPRVFGHRAGMENVKKIIRHSSDLGVKVLTLYAFSTENWKRPFEEVSAIMGLLVEYLVKELDEMHKNGVVVRTIGDISKLPENAKKCLFDSMEKTKNNEGLILNLALNYGSRAEILRAVQKISGEVKEGKINPEDITEEMISKNLDTGTVPDPDFIIRTSGEERISNFLLWQIAYSEFYFTDVFWPDFDEKEYEKALLEYQNRKRRYGGI